MEYMSSQTDQNGISHPKRTLNGILEFDRGAKSESEGTKWNITLNILYSVRSAVRRLIACGTRSHMPAGISQSGCFKACYEIIRGVVGWSESRPEFQYKYF
jgi:hypothetical protein